MEFSFASFNRVGRYRIDDVKDKSSSRVTKVSCNNLPPTEAAGSQ